MFTPADRERIRAAIIERARTDARLTGSLARLRHGENPREGRGLDQLPAESGSVDSALTERIRPVLLALTSDRVASAKS